MKLNYVLDIDEKSTWFVNTPNQVSKTLPFFMNEYGHYLAQSAYFTERQKQNNYLFIYTISGKGYLKYKEHEYILEPGQAAIIYCSNYHIYKTSQGGLWNFKWFHFSGTSAKEYYSLLNQGGLNIVTVKDSVKFHKIIDDLFSCFDINDIAANVKASMHIINLISTLIIENYTGENNQKHVEHKNDIEKVINYIQYHYSSKIVLDDLTGIACMSKHYFLRLFKKYVGVSPYDYLLHHRINKAKDLLRTTDYTVSEICSHVGFNDYNNFIREFKKIVGLTPLRYRKNC